MTMSDYTAVEHDAETNETIERVMTQSEINALMETFDGFNESITIESDTNDQLPIVDSEPNPLPIDTTE